MIPKILAHEIPQKVLHSVALIYKVAHIIDNIMNKLFDKVRDCFGFTVHKGLNPNTPFFVIKAA